MKSVWTYIDDSILQHRSTHSPNAHDVLAHTCSIVVEEPAGALLVVCDLGRVVALVQELEDGGEDLGLLVRQVDAFAGCLEELRPAGLGEVGRFAENVFVGGEEAGGWADRDGDDG